MVFVRYLVRISSVLPEIYWYFIFFSLQASFKISLIPIPNIFTVNRAGPIVGAV
jgi:hypothetical protein